MATTNMSARISAANAPAKREEAPEDRWPVIKDGSSHGIPSIKKKSGGAERAGPANGGALSTAGGIVFQGTGSGEFTALDAKNRRTALVFVDTDRSGWPHPSPTKSTGKQYVAILVGRGARGHDRR